MLITCETRIKQLFKVPMNKTKINLLHDILIKLIRYWSNIQYTTYPNTILRTYIALAIYINSRVNFNSCKLNISGILYGWRGWSKLEHSVAPARRQRKLFISLEIRLYLILYTSFLPQEDQRWSSTKKKNIQSISTS